MLIIGVYFLFSLTLDPPQAILLSACTIWSYTVLYLSIIDVPFHQVTLLMFYDDQTTNLTFIG